LALFLSAIACFVLEEHFQLSDRRNGSQFTEVAAALLLSEEMRAPQANEANVTGRKAAWRLRCQSFKRTAPEPAKDARKENNSVCILACAGEQNRIPCGGHYAKRE
jgi:hypothetical protein